MKDKAKDSAKVIADPSHAKGDRVVGLINLGITTSEKNYFTYLEGQSFGVKGTMGEANGVPLFHTTAVQPLANCDAAKAKGQMLPPGLLYPEKYWASTAVSVNGAAGGGDSDCPPGEFHPTVNGSVQYAYCAKQDGQERADKTLKNVLGWDRPATLPPPNVGTANDPNARAPQRKPDTVKAPQSPQTATTPAIQAAIDAAKGDEGPLSPVTLHAKGHDTTIQQFLDNGMRYDVKTHNWVLVEQK